MHLSSVTILDEVWHYVAPGGQEELEGLTKFVRDPGTTSTAEEARERIRSWLQARKRAAMVGIPELSAHEQMKVYEKLVRSIEKRYPEFAHRINQMKFSREGRAPTDDFVKQFHSLVDEELRLVEADEMVTKNRKKTSVMEDVNVNAVRAQAPPDQSGPGDSGRESTEKSKKPCRQFQKTGECRFGDKCISVTMCKNLLK